MNIILEGPDGTGKSTFANELAKYIADQGFDVAIIPGRGPEESPGEINDRIRSWLEIENIIPENFLIFDRHPCISQPIYGPLGFGTPVEENLLEKFYSHSKNLIVYFQGTKESLKNHQTDRESDSEEYLKNLNKNYISICNKYDLWAINYADIIVRNFNFENVYKSVGASL